MDYKKEYQSSRRSSSIASSTSTRSGGTQSSIHYVSPKGNSSRRSSLSVASSTTSGYALSHTLSSSGQFVDPRKRVEPVTITRVDGLQFRLLTPAETAMPIRLLDREKETSAYMPPAISRALAVHFDVTVEGLAAKRSWIHLGSCRRKPDDRVDKFIRDCYVRLTEIGDPAQAYLSLPPCFYLSAVQFNLGLAGGCATFAWLEFDNGWVRSVVPSALITGLEGSLARFRSVCDCDDDYRCVCDPATLTLVYNKSVNGRQQRHTINASYGHFKSDKAFPAYIQTNDDFVAWRGNPEKSAKGEIAYYKNFQAKNLRFNYFGELVKVDFLRSPGSPTRLPAGPKVVPVKKKKGFFRTK